jgi:hypothetical protein
MYLQEKGMDKGKHGMILLIYILVIFTLYAFIQNWDKKVSQDNGHRMMIPAFQL